MLTFFSSVFGLVMVAATVLGLLAVAWVITEGLWRAAGLCQRKWVATTAAEPPAPPQPGPIYASRIEAERMLELAAGTTAESDKMYHLCRDPLGEPQYFHSYNGTHGIHWTPLRHMARPLPMECAARWAEQLGHNHFVVHANLK